MWRKTWLVAVIAIIACRTALVGQQPVRAPILRGAVRDSTTSLALPGVVVSVLDARGATLARTIADGNGRFAVTVGAGAAQLHLIRIGFQPRDVKLPAHLPPSLELGMVRLPALLSAVHISDQELCPGSAERGAAFQLWEEARAGLLATIVARESNPAQAQFITYNRHTGPDDDRVIAQTTQILSGRTTRPFVASAPAPTFARTGYMVESDSGRIFDAPDADVLLDESFATTHCFRLQRPDGSHSGQVGLAFAPVSSRARDTLVDVAGVIWIDEDTPQLRSLEFVYTALEPAAMQAKTGGEEIFRTMANGIAFVERWELRLPVLAIPDQEPVRHDRYTAEPVAPPSFPLDLRCRCVGECRERVATSAPTDIFRRSRFRGRCSIWRRAARR